METRNAHQDRRRHRAFTDAVIASVKQSQELATSGINVWVDLAGKTFTVPSLDALPFADPVPNPSDVVEASFGFAEELLATQKELATKVVDAVAPKAKQVGLSPSAAFPVRATPRPGRFARRRSLPVSASRSACPTTTPVTTSCTRSARSSAPSVSSPTSRCASSPTSRTCPTRT